MIGKESKLYSTLFLKCPKCHESDLFEERNAYAFKKFFDMPETCPKCGQRFLLEPGFYYGAMYVSYGTTIAWLVAVYVALLVLYPSFTIELYLLLGIGSLIALTPYFFRLSRSIWINMFVSFDKDVSKEFTEPKVEHPTRD